jgi:pSer/pThr/pTyr-binding forkhead associated (FHA) protein
MVRRSRLLAAELRAEAPVTIEQQQLWCNRQLHLAIEGPQGRSEVVIGRPFARLGRNPASDVVLDSPWVAKRSLYLHATDEGVFCFYFQPEETSVPHIGQWLAPQQPVLVGPYRIFARLEGDQPAAPAGAGLDAWGTAAGPFPVFRIYSEGKLLDKRRFRARLNLVGRRHECALQVKGQEVSAFHCALYWHEGRMWCIDLNSSNGTLLNGHSASCAEVRLGDTLEIGEFQLHFHRLSRGGSRGLARPLADEPAVRAETLPHDSAGEVEAGDAQPDSASETDQDQVEPVPPAPLAMSSQPAPAAAEPMLPATTRPSALATPVETTRQELTVLRTRVEQLARLAQETSKRTAQQVVQQARDAFERERQRIEQELARRAAELERDRLALEAQRTQAARELSTQVRQLRAEAAQLVQQRQAMERARLLWSSERHDMERKLQTYAQQLQRLEHTAPLAVVAGAPAVPPVCAAIASAEPDAAPADAVAAPADATALPPAAPTEEQRGAALALAAVAKSSGELTARSHVLESRVHDPAAGAAPVAESSDWDLSTPVTDDFLAKLAGAGARAPVLEGSMAAMDATATAPPADSSPRPVIKGRKSSAKGGGHLFEAVTEKLVEIERVHRRNVLILCIGGFLAVIGLAAMMVAASILLR